jgi:hypothetical protein
MEMFNVVFDRKYKVDFFLRSFRVALALRCFHLRHRKLPQKLAELVPEYLENIPTDPFDGKPLRYSQEKRIVYSVGKNLTDEGGSREKTFSYKLLDDEEPTLRIPRWED